MSDVRSFPEHQPRHRLKVQVTIELELTSSQDAASLEDDLTDLDYTLGFIDAHYTDDESVFTCKVRVVEHR
ncbi:hypothetical protein JHS3_21890 [Jeongeupia sp. HS-3]|uniref:hypothetical protein n=1 Tax=Jeongeupia sp. HS-3 TaxID=1009682 RepID=UPI0018A34418|nr:hypothetical protein [Jeongeupia sp. HS-3]BCL76453.1 hypothetical protein JHS3_21890 [Jeongeupia sp. HS-3]